MRFADQTVIVTGAAHGIGKATALRFAEEGARLVIADIQVQTAEQVAVEIHEKGGKAIAIALDVRARSSVESMLQRTMTEFGGVDVLAAIAGIGPMDPFLTLPEETWRETLDVNLTGVFLCGQIVARQMVTQGSGGRIVNMASTNGLVGEEEQAHYNASKFGVVGLTLSMAIELASYNITVNAVCPGFINTRMNKEVIARPGFVQQYLKKIPLRRFGEPDDIAGAVLFLASEDARYITGTTLVVDGGQLAS